MKKIETLKPVLDKIVEKSKLTVISCSHHQFNPHGATILYLLAESHLSVHTWPEFSYMHIDLFSCNSDTSRAFRAIEMLKDEFEAELISKKILGPDLYEKAQNSCKAPQ